jgi:hypothetical protein
VDDPTQERTEERVGLPAGAIMCWDAGLEISGVDD